MSSWVWELYILAISFIVKNTHIGSVVITPEDFHKIVQFGRYLCV